MKILITGSNGQLGSEIKKISSEFNRFQFDFHDIDTLDILDETQLEKYFNQNKPAVVINCAAYTAVDKAEEDKKGALNGNCILVKNLTNECEKNNSLLIHISTDYVFDGKNYRPYIEEDPIHPQSEYGRTKLLGEKEALRYKNSIIIRTSWLYSAFGNNFVKTMMRLGKEKDSLNVIFDQVGSPTNAADLALVILQIADKTMKDQEHFKPGIYHYANEGVCSWYDFAKVIMEISGLDCKIHPIESHKYPLPAKRPHYSVLNKKKIKSTYNIEIPYWKDSLIKCIKLLS